MEKVLFAHQSTIPPYRVPFYNALEKNKPDWWDFEVVDTKKESEFAQPINFKINFTKEINLNIGKQRIRYQNFLSSIKNYDLLIVEDAVNNLSYPLSHFLKSYKTKLCYWGHGRDVTINDDSNPFKKGIEAYKLRQVIKSDGYFAYLPTVKEYLINQGVHSDKIFVVQNTIDIVNERKQFKEAGVEKAAVGHDRNILFVGRLTESKKIPTLLKIYEELKQLNNDYNLTIVGDGDESIKEKVLSYKDRIGLDYLGEIRDKVKLSKIFKDNSFYLFPGYVGLGPLHAMCYDLIPVVKESKHHKPEFEYLTEENSIILSESASSKDFATAIETIVSNEEIYVKKRKNIWPSIKKYTIKNMAENFVHGINMVLSNTEK
jgi:glycosyltransferase involved in cell wall biosynthesis